MKQLIKNEHFIGYAFLTKLGLDSKITSWDQTHRIPRQKLRIYSYSEDYRSESRSKYFKFDSCIRCLFLKHRCLASSRGPGGFTEFREADRNHFHLSCYRLRLNGFWNAFYQPRPSDILFGRPRPQKFSKSGMLIIITGLSRRARTAAAAGTR